MARNYQTIPEEQKKRPTQNEQRRIHTESIQRKDIFQLLIEKFFVICEEEIWRQRNLDRHRPKNKTNHAAIIKTDREVRQLYGLHDEVCPTDKEQFYKIDLDTRINQTIHEKQRWIKRWRPAIQSSRKRAKRDAITNTTVIWKYFSKKRPKNRTLHAHRKRIKQHRANLRKQRNAPVRGITEGIGSFQIIQTNRSSSRTTTESPQRKIFKIKNPSVADYFSKKDNKDKPDDRYGDAGNDQ